jgi:hypothetical protein
MSTFPVLNRWCATVRAACLPSWPSAQAWGAQLLRQLGYLRVVSVAPQRLEEDGRVLHLFRNRAELKKAYGDVQAEIYQLKDRIKQQEGATAHVQAMLEALELRLASPVSGQQALIFYQLRDLWKTGGQLISALIAEQIVQHEERERLRLLSEFNRQQYERRQEVERTFNRAQLAASDARSRLADVRRSWDRANRWWHYFKRRDLGRRLEVTTIDTSKAITELAAARNAYDAVLNLPVPPFPGLSVEARRAINLAALAYGEIIAQPLLRTSLLQLCGDASRRRAPADSYGDAATCLALMAQIARAKLALAARSSDSAEVQQLIRQLGERARYRGAADVLPTEDSICETQQVLREDCWGLQRLLLG